MTEAEPEKPEIAVDFVLKAGDYLAPLERLFRGSRWIAVALVAAILAAIPVVAAIMLGDLSRTLEAARLYFSGRVGLGAYGVMAIVIAFVLFGSWLRAGIVTVFIRVSPHQDKPYRIELSAKGIHARAEDLASDLDWSAVRAVGFSRRGFFLTIWTGAYLAVPRRAFGAREDYEAAVDFVLRHLPPGTRIAGRPGLQTRMSSTQ